MAEPTQALSSSIDALTEFLLGEGRMGDTLHRVAELGQQAIPGAHFTGLTLLQQDGRPTTAVCTDPTTQAVDQAQYDLGDGPCLTAFREKRVVKVRDMKVETRWPQVTARATENGVQSSLSAPLIVRDSGIGALNFYSLSDNAFSDDDEETAQTFSLHAAIVVANAQAYWSAHELSEQLQQAMVSRAAIEQAKGVIIEQSGVSSEEAFELLRRASQRENRKLREIAAEIVKRAQERQR